MNYMIKIYVLIVFFVITITTLTSAIDFIDSFNSGSKKKICLLERVHKLIGYNCANIDLKEIPTNLRQDTEMLDLSFNRIRDLTANSFSRYTSVKYLYLFENMIQSCEEDTFSQLTKLEAIDLSSNALTTIPMDILKLPLLRNFYIAHNNLKDIHEDIKRLQTPIGAPLQHLSLAYCKLNRIPNFGVLPDLWQLNISGNPLNDINPQQFSPLCQLKVVDFNDTKMMPCACQTISDYLAKRSVHLKNIEHCSLFDEFNCPNLKNLTLDTDEYYHCTELQAIKKVAKDTKIAWISISCGITGFLLSLLGGLYCCHRRNVRKMNESAQHEKLKRIHSTTVSEEEENENDDSFLDENKNKNKL